MQRASLFCYILPYRSQNFISGGKKIVCPSTLWVNIRKEFKYAIRFYPLEPISKYIILCGMEKLDKVQLLINSEETSFCTYIFLNKYQL